MVRAKGPSKGAHWLAKERGLIGPGFTSSCAKLFEEKGDTWLTNRDKEADYPLSRSRPGDKPLTATQIRQREIYEKARARLERAGVSVPKAFPEAVRPSFHIDPDLDMFTKAGRVEAREKYVDPVGEPIQKDHARWRANLLRKTRLAMSAVSIEVKDKPRKKGVVKGGFYLFDAPIKQRGKK